MYREEFEKNWQQLKGKIQAKWNKWTQEDMAKINGKYELFSSWLQKKYSYTREQAEREIHNWCEMHCKHDHTHKDSCSSCCKSHDKNSCSTKPGFWKSSDKKDDHSGHKDKKRKAG